MFTKCSIDNKKKRFDYYRGIYCIKKWCEKVKDREMEIINCKEEEMIPLTNEEIKCYKGQKVYHICKNSFVTMKIIKKKNLNYFKKSEITASTQENLEKLLIVFAI